MRGRHEVVGVVRAGHDDLAHVVVVAPAVSQPRVHEEVRLRHLSACCRRRGPPARVGRARARPARFRGRWHECCLLRDHIGDSVVPALRLRLWRVVVGCYWPAAPRADRLLLAPPLLWQALWGALRARFPLGGRPVLLEAQPAASGAPPRLSLLSSPTQHAAHCIRPCVLSYSTFC